jgi:hypothetical protein
MKMSYAIPFIVLALSVGACGKKDDQVVTTVPVVNPQPLPVPTYPYPYPNPGQYPTADLPTFCQSYGGVMTGSLCKFSRTYTNNAWLSFSIGDLTPQIDMIQTGDRVTVVVSNNPKVYVGGYQYGSGSMSFTANNSGYLRFSKWSFSTFSVQQVSLERCYSSPSQLASCP